MRRLASLFALLVAAVAGAACSLGPGSGSEAEDSADIVSGCGSENGDAILRAAKGGPSIVRGEIESRGNRVVGGPYVGGRAIGDGMASLIASAKQEVMIEFYEISDSWLASRLRDAVLALPKSVRVYVLIHPTKTVKGPLGITLPESEEQAAARVGAIFQNAPNVTAGSWKRDGKTPILAGVVGIELGIMHTKQIVVDGARAFMTDTNIQTYGDPADEKDGLGWNQFGVAFEGEAAARLREAAVEAWSHAKHPVTFPDPPAPATVHACTRMVVLGRGAQIGRESSADQGYSTLFTSAKKQVRAMTPNLNDALARSSLADATANADVHLILSRGFNDQGESFPGMGGTNVQNVEKLAALAKDKCRLHVRFYAHERGQAIEGSGLHASHAKFASADGKVLITGSQNLDTLSWTSSRELGLAIDDAETTAKFDQAFDEMWDRSPVAFEQPGCQPAK